MQHLPPEIWHLIIDDDYDMYVVLLKIPIIGVILCSEYSIALAKRKFRIKVKKNNDRIEYTINGLLHRSGDRPAIIYSDGGAEWFKYGLEHREHMPAKEYPNGYQAWFRNGKRHRIDGPALITSYSEKWYKDGIIHREDGPAIIDREHKFEAWVQNGKEHRIDGPAVTYSSGRVEWYQNGLLHRENGPAVIHRDGTEEWYENGIKFHDMSKSC